MLLRLQNATASMSQLVQRQDRAANNLANVNTTGFRRDRTFAAVLGERLDAERAPTSDREEGQWVSREAGPIEQTGNALDFALADDGFFTVQDEAGQVRYTRAGRFEPDAEGTHRTPECWAVLSAEGAALTVPPTGTVTASARGELAVDGQPLGRLGTVRFEDARALERLDGASFTADPALALPVETPSVKQGFLEGSNVSAVREMTDLIQNTRLFESQQRTVQTQDGILGQLVRDLGRF